MDITSEIWPAFVIAGVIWQILLSVAVVWLTWLVCDKKRIDAPQVDENFQRLSDEMVTLRAHYNNLEYSLKNLIAENKTQNQLLARHEELFTTAFYTPVEEEENNQPSIDWLANVSDQLDQL